MTQTTKTNPVHQTARYIRQLLPEGRSLTLWISDDHDQVNATVHGGTEEIAQAIATRLQTSMPIRNIIQAGTDPAIPFWVMYAAGFSVTVCED